MSPKGLLCLDNSSPMGVDGRAIVNGSSPLETAQRQSAISIYFYHMVCPR
jgi:hypothetical protein